jgi:NADH-quinone oxidoreductase E subunit
MDELINSILLKYSRNTRENLIPVMQEIQNRAGHLNGEYLLQVSKYLGIPLNQIYGVATFYNQFHFQKRGTFFIQVCRGTNCYIDHSSSLLDLLEKRLKIKAGQTTRDGRFTLETVSCFGTCSKSPVVCINGDYHSQVTEEQVEKLLSLL